MSTIVANTPPRSCFVLAARVAVELAVPRLPPADWPHWHARTNTPLALVDPEAPPTHNHPPNHPRRCRRHGHTGGPGHDPTEKNRAKRTDRKTPPSFLPSDLPTDGAQVEKRSCVASTIVGGDVVIFTASVLASRWPKISPVVAEMMVSPVQSNQVESGRG